MRKHKRYFGVMMLLTLITTALIVGCGGGSSSSNNSNGSGSNNIPTGITLPTIPNRTFKITDYGASSASPDNTTKIQTAIDACGAAGGGTVVVPAGTFLCGPLTLKSNINLELSSGAILKLLGYGTYPGSGSTDDVADFLYGSKVSNVKISGTGTIEGQGPVWWSTYKTTKAAGNAIARPCVIRFDECTNVEISGITIQNAPNVHITIGKKSNSATIANVTINSPESSPNTDGIDTWSRNIYITKCQISCGDDNIAMDNNSQNVTITNCTFGTGHGCSIGSYAANINNIIVDHCSFAGTENGIRMKSHRERGGAVHDLTYSNITMTDVRIPIVISSYYPESKIPRSPATAISESVSATTPNWYNVTLKNIVATGCTKAGTLCGLPEWYIGAKGGVTFDNVQINASKTMTVYFATNFQFTNGSTISVSRGKAITSYNASISGINADSGRAE